MPQLLDQGDWIEVTGLTPGSWTVVNLDAYSPPANYSGVVLACHRTQLSPDGHDRFGIRAVGDRPRTRSKPSNLNPIALV